MKKINIALIIVLGIILASRSLFAGDPGNFVSIDIASFKTAENASIKNNVIHIGTYGKASKGDIFIQASEIRIQASINLADRALSVKLVYDDGAEEKINAMFKQKDTLTDLILKPKRWKGRRIQRISFTHGISGIWILVHQIKLLDQGKVTLINDADLAGTKIDAKGRLNNGVLMLFAFDPSEKRQVLTNLQSQKYIIVGSRHVDVKIPKTSTLRFWIQMVDGGEKVVDLEFSGTVLEQIIDFGIEPEKIKKIVLEASGSGNWFGIRKIAPVGITQPTHGFEGEWTITTHYMIGENDGSTSTGNFQIIKNESSINYTLKWFQPRSGALSRTAQGVLSGDVLLYQCDILGGNEKGKLVITTGGEVMGGVFEQGENKGVIQARYRGAVVEKSNDGLR